MSDSESKKAIYYTSHYRHGVDGKRRVQIPAKWRPADPGIEFSLILWPKGTQEDACLLVLPPEEWKTLVDKVKAMSFSDEDAQALRGRIGKKTDLVTLDRAGRVCIPEWMAKAAGIEGEALLVGMVDRFEIWNPRRYEAASAVEEARGPQAFRLI